MDTGTAKKLLQSGTLEELQSAVLELSSLRQLSDQESNSEDEYVTEQLAKLEILFHSKIFSLLPNKIDQSATCTELGKLWMEMGDVPRAMGQLEKAIVLDDNNFHAFLLLADGCAASTNLQEKAIEYTEKAIEILQKVKTQMLAYDCAQAYCKLASISEKQSNFAQAIAVIESAIPKLCDSDNIEDDDQKNDVQSQCRASLYGTLGRLKEMTGDYEGAVEALRMALPACQLVHGPDHPETQELAYLLEMAESVL